MAKRTLYHRCRKRGVKLGLKREKLSEYIEKCIAKEKYKGSLRNLSVVLKAKERPKHIVYLNVTPKEDPLTPIVTDFFQNPEEIPLSKRERLNEFMKEPRGYDEIKKFLEELENE